VLKRCLVLLIVLGACGGGGETGESCDSNDREESLQGDGGENRLVCIGN
jgi:hypothetical protein